jgi:hypothetical protein
MYQVCRRQFLTVLLLTAGCGGGPFGPAFEEGPVPADRPIRGLEGLSIRVSSLAFEGPSVRPAIYLEVPPSPGECPRLDLPEEWYLLVQGERFPLNYTGGVIQYPPGANPRFFGAGSELDTWTCDPIFGSVPHRVVADAGDTLSVGIGHRDSSITLDADDVFHTRRWTWPGPAAIDVGGSTVVEYTGPASDVFSTSLTSASATLSSHEGPPNLDTTWEAAEQGGGRFALESPASNPPGIYSVTGQVVVAFEGRCVPEGACTRSASSSDLTIHHQVDFMYSVEVK